MSYYYFHVIVIRLFLGSPIERKKGAGDPYKYYIVNYIGRPNDVIGVTSEWMAALAK